MDESLAWQARYDELSTALRRIGAALGDRDAVPAQRDAAAAEFVATWQAITRHIKQLIHAPLAPPDA